MSGTTLAIIAAAVVAAGLISYLIAIYNGLIQVKNNVEKAFNNIDVLLLQRYDELPKLVDAAKGYMKHERDLLAGIVKLRTKYRDTREMNGKIATENELADLLQRFHVQVEQYPDLKAIDSFNQLQIRISGVEEQIADRRELFNDSVNIYNIRIEQFPDVIFARLLKYEKQVYLKVPDEKKKDVTLDLPT